MSRNAWMFVGLALAAAASARAETVYQPGHRTWTNSWVPPHYETRPDTRYVAPRNQPLETMVSPSQQAARPEAPARNAPLETLIEPPKPKENPPVSVFTPAPQYDPYYNALNAASRPLQLQKPPHGGSADHRTDTLNR
jgi:hypothetical protein